jgi:flavin reductase (DIM6/NTAB) family NADH-FMN oxidoreductase RutF
MTVSAELFREVFRRWPSGVAVATSRLGDWQHGMVVGSFCSLSAVPPLVLFSAGKASRTQDLVQQSAVFAVSILAESQVEIFERFAGFDRSYDHDRFVGLTTIMAVTGAPIFPDALAWVDCRVVARHPGTTYTIFVGEVLAAGLGRAAESAPLIYFRRQRHQLRELSTSALALHSVPSGVL